MKVVCINNVLIDYNENSYNSVDYLDITLSKIYDVHETRSYMIKGGRFYKDSNEKDYIQYKILNDNNQLEWFDSSLFNHLEDIRDEKLNQLGVH